MYRALATGLLALSLACSACVPRAIKPQLSQLEIRQFQSREYDIKNTKLVMKAILNVLQDDNFIVKNAVAELGLITAVKEVDIEDSGEAFMSQLFMGDHAAWRKNSIVEVSANVSEFGRQTRVRVNFQMKILDNRGSIVEVETILDPKYYQDFFVKVDKGVFIERENI